MAEYSTAKTVEYQRIFPNFENCARCEKDFKDNKDNSLHLGRKYARIFVLGHYLFLVAHSFPRATLSENCSLLGTDNVRGENIRAYFRAKWRLLFIYTMAAKPIKFLELHYTMTQFLMMLNYSMSPSWISGDKITNERVAREGYNHFISNKRE